jgi:hypothetical protein
VHQANRLVNDLLLESTSHSYLPPGGAPASFKRLLGGCGYMQMTSTLSETSFHPGACHVKT